MEWREKGKVPGSTWTENIVIHTLSPRPPRCSFTEEIAPKRLADSMSVKWSHIGKDEEDKGDLTQKSNIIWKCFLCYFTQVSWVEAL